MLARVLVPTYRMAGMSSRIWTGTHERAIPTERERRETLLTIAHPMTGRTVEPPNMAEAITAFVLGKKYEQWRLDADAYSARCDQWERLGVGWDAAKWLASNPDVTPERVAVASNRQLKVAHIPKKVLEAIRQIIPEPNHEAVA